MPKTRVKKVVQYHPNVKTKFTRMVALTDSEYNLFLNEINKGLKSVNQNSIEVTMLWKEMPQHFEVDHRLVFLNPVQAKYLNILLGSLGVEEDGAFSQEDTVIKVLSEKLESQYAL